jgi:hemerythrin-like domain-containing protein
VSQSDLDALAELALDRRVGWPEPLRFLLLRYPRPIWPTHRNLGSLGRFWLQRHQMFRELAAAFLAALGELREGRLEPAELGRWLTPRFAFFLRELHGHHQVEDLHYFPVFMRAEPRLALGFEVLEQDHVVIDQALGLLAADGRGLVGALATGEEATAAAERLAGALQRFLQQIDRHLDDEEDLLIPLILDRGEAAFATG